ncbi:MAG: fibronectin type III domain-containing protein [bacterium]|nr:fibronectin type III domain-containing protein [bacterium]
MKTRFLPVMHWYIQNPKLFCIAFLLSGFCSCGLIQNDTPSTPSNFRVQDIDANRVNLAWDKSDGHVVYYLIERRDPNGSLFEKDAGYFKTTYMDSNLECETTYYYRIQARGEEQNTMSDNPKTLYSDYSEEIPVTTKTCLKAAVISQGDNGEGYNNGCAITISGGLKCWGTNDHGQLGLGIFGYDVPGDAVDIAGLTEGVKDVSVGDMHICALTSLGGVKCWGSHKYGQLGTGSTDDLYDYSFGYSYGPDPFSPDPLDVTGLSSGVTAISSGANYTCALTTQSGVKCWGNGFNYPVNITGLSGGIVSLRTGYDTACVLISDRKIECWGPESWENAPSEVFTFTESIKGIAVGAYHFCALFSGGDVKCWKGWVGEFGGSLSFGDTPVDIPGLSGRPISINAGSYYTCILNSDGVIECWYPDVLQTRQLYKIDLSQTDFPAKKFTAFSVGFKFAYAITSNGGVKWWEFDPAGSEPGTKVDDLYVSGLAGFIP